MTVLSTAENELLLTFSYHPTFAIDFVIGSLTRNAQVHTLHLQQPPGIFEKHSVISYFTDHLVILGLQGNSPNFILSQ